MAIKTVFRIPLNVRILRSLAAIFARLTDHNNTVHNCTMAICFWLLDLCIPFMKRAPRFLSIRCVLDSVELNVTDVHNFQLIEYYLFIL